MQDHRSLLSSDKLHDYTKTSFSKFFFFLKVKERQAVGKKISNKSHINTIFSYNQLLGVKCVKNKAR